MEGWARILPIFPSSITFHVLRITFYALRQRVNSFLKHAEIDAFFLEGVQLTVTDQICCAVFDTGNRFFRGNQGFPESPPFLLWELDSALQFLALLLCITRYGLMILITRLSNGRYAFAARLTISWVMASIFASYWAE